MTNVFVAPRPSMFIQEELEALQKAAGKAETALGNAFNLPFLTWNRKGKIAAARATYKAAMAELTEARAELAVSRDYEAKMAADNDAVAKAATEETIAAAESLIPNFAAIRDAAAKAGVAEYKDGRQLVRTGTVKMEDGALAVERAQKLGSRVKIGK